MKMRSWSESSGAMLVPSTFTGWYKKTMITSARPMAINRSRVQTRISLRRECSGADRSAAGLESGCSLLTVAVTWAVVATEEDAGSRVSGEVEVAGCFSSGLSIFRCLVFIAWPSRPAPDAIYCCAWGGRRPLGLLTFTEIHRTPALLLANVGYLSKGAKVLGTG